MDALIQQAVQFQRSGRWSEAEQIYRQILQSNPQDARAWFEFGNLLAATGRIADAGEAFRNATVGKPDFAEAFCNLGNAHQILGDLAGAKTAFEQAIQLRPTFAEAWNNLGNVLQDQSNAANAIAKHLKAIELRPGFVQARYSLGGAYRSLGELDESLEAYDRALALHPQFDKAQANRAGVLRDMGRQQDAIDAFKQALDLKSRPETLSNLIYTLPLHPNETAESIWPFLQRWDAEFAKPLAVDARRYANLPDPNRRLRIGYVSADFNGHPVGRFLLPVLENHDQAAFEIYCYSDSKIKDAVNQRSQKAADRWRETALLSPAQLAELIRADQIDILVDLASHTAGNRLLTFATRPAPVQVTWLGYPGTTGLTAMDYRLSDPHLDPPGDEKFYSERTIELPDCYWCFDPLAEEPIAVNELPAMSNGFITFGSLNNFAKVSEAAISIWAQAMIATPKSRLILLGPRGSTRARFEKQMSQSGVEASRISWLDRMPRTEYLKASQQIDIVLDSFPYTGHTTTFDALWLGVPVMTMTGRTAVSRGSYSVLSNLKLDECIAHSPAEYVLKVKNLASDPMRLRDLRHTLRRRLEESPLMDKPRFARGIEAVYRRIWRDWCQKR